jgi:predicted enzyme related to lactoylglutathione lyase
VTLQTKNLQLYLHHAKNPPRTQERKKIKIPQISFKVDDIDTAFTYLRQAKVNITRGIVEYDPTTFVFNFLDPDGNSMAFESDRRKKA